MGKTSDQVIFLKHGKQKNLHEKVVAENEPQPELLLVLEFESEWTQSELGEAFIQLNMISLQFNGGTFIVNFPENISIYNFMQLIIKHEIPLQYLRNISKSTRRFFVS